MTKPANPVTGQATGNPLGYKGGSLWLWVAAAFLFLGLLWAGLFLAAHSARIESVPLAPKGARP